MARVLVQGQQRVQARRPDGFKEYEPDRLLIEKKASGHSLIQELRKGSLPVKAVNPDRSKKSRVHAAEIPFEQGCVWYVDLPWVQPVICECAQFPNGEYDDWVDTVTQAIIWMRKTYHLEFKDEDEEPVPEREPRPIYGCVWSAGLRDTFGVLSED